MTGFAIVDAHQHFWDPSQHYYPWLCDEPQIPFRYGDYAAIRRPYRPAHYRADTGGWRIEHCVYIETEWDPADPVGEMAWVDAVRRVDGLPSVAVAQAWLDRPDLDAVLERLRAFAFVRGVRHKPRANASAADSRPGGMSEPRWRDGYRRLTRAGLHFELQTPWWHLYEAERLARDFADAPIIVNHCAMPAPRDQPSLDGWSAAIGKLAGCANVAVKLSGIGQAGTGGAPAGWDLTGNRDVVLRLIDAFGVERCMFASNFPVDKLCASFSTIYSAYESYVTDFSQHEQRALFRDNAIRWYRIDPVPSLDGGV